MNIRHVAKVFLLNNLDQVLIIHRSKTAPRRPLTWDLPGGITEADEKPVESASRELYEESGIKTNNIKEVLSYIDDSSYGEIMRSFYLANTKSSNVSLSYEHDKYMWVAKKDFVKYINYEPLVRAFEAIF